VSPPRPERVAIAVAPGLRLSAIVREGVAPRGSDGVSFLLVHGLASNARMWDAVAGELSRRGVGSVALDLRGHGLSDRPDGGYGVATVATDVAAVIAALGMDRPIVAGQSWGGNVVLELAACRPELLRGVVCVDGGTIDLGREFSDWGECWERLAPPRLTGTPVAQLEASLRDVHPDWPEESIEGALANFEVREDGTVAPWLTRDRHRLVLRGLWEHRPSSRYASVHSPVLFTPAERDGQDAHRALLRRQDIERAVATIPRARARWFPDADHDLHAQRPQELVTVMLSAVEDGFFAQ
jgi:pimeloyl-ACP methyl ester carboxylesterase